MLSLKQNTYVGINDVGAIPIVLLITHFVIFKNRMLVIL